MDPAQADRSKTYIIVVEQALLNNYNIMAAAIPLRAGERKVVIVGAGFLGRCWSYASLCLVLDEHFTWPGSHIARALSQNPSNRIQLTSRNPTKLRDQLLSDDISVNKPRAKSLLPTIHSHSLLPPVTADITDLNSLKAAFTDATVVISLVGLLSGTREQFDKVQWKGVQNVVDAIKEVNARKGGGSGIKKIVHVSAIGANEDSGIDYFRTKGLGEKVLFEAFQTNDIQSPSPHVTVIRPSLVFGPDDSFFNVRPLFHILLLCDLHTDKVMACSDLRLWPSSCHFYQCLVGEAHDSNRFMLVIWLQP